MYLNPTQKIIIESISSSPKNLGEIASDLKLSSIQVFKNLRTLATNSYIMEYKGKYSINSKNFHEISEAINDKDTKIFDIKKISESFTKLDLNKKINFKRVHLTQQEMTTVNSLLKQLEFYLNEKMQNKSTQPLYKKHIFYWGQQTYEEAYL